jgi:hypothetical protein
MTHRNSQSQQYGSLYFPKIARGHGISIRKDRNGHEGKGCQQACAAGRRLEAHYTDKGSYVDGHYQTQDVALRAHQEGHR